MLVSIMLKDRNAFQHNAEKLNVLTLRFINIKKKSENLYDRNETDFKAGDKVFSSFNARLYQDEAVQKSAKVYTTENAKITFEDELEYCKKEKKLLKTDKQLMMITDRSFTTD